MLGLFVCWEMVEGRLAVFDWICTLVCYAALGSRECDGKGAMLVTHSQRLGHFITLRR